MPFCEMYFDDVKLTEDMMVGEYGAGFKNLMKNFEMERSLIIAQCLGCAQACMDDAAAYVNDRITFGKPISSYQLIQEKLTEMETKLINVRNMLYYVLWRMDQGMSIRTESALLKRYGARACTEVCQEAVQISAAWAIPPKPASVASQTTFAACKSPVVLMKSWFTSPVVSSRRSTKSNRTSSGGAISGADAGVGR